MPIYNPNRGPVVKTIMAVAVIASCAGIWNRGLGQYREDNPYAGMPSEFQSAMEDMGLEHAYDGETNTEIENMLMAYDVVDSADANVITSNGKVWSVTVTLTGDGWKNVCLPLAEEIRKLYPGTDVSFYEVVGSHVNIIYTE
ncbi:MAG: hypothetical protein R3Y63_13090 [Eubacteriales bacterium]